MEEIYQKIIKEADDKMAKEKIPLFLLKMGLNRSRSFMKEASNGKKANPKSYKKWRFSDVSNTRWYENSRRDERSSCYRSGHHYCSLSPVTWNRIDFFKAQTF